MIIFFIPHTERNKEMIIFLIRRVDHGLYSNLESVFSRHTFGMRFPIDVLFVNADGSVIKIVERMGAWRMAGSLQACVTVLACRSSRAPARVSGASALMSSSIARSGS